MRIELADLENGKGAFTHVYAPDELRLADDRVQLLEPPTVSGEVRQSAGRVHVTGGVSGRIQLECDRCLQPVALPVDSEFQLEYVTTRDYEAQQAVELSGADLDLSTFDGAGIDLDELVTEELLLAIPDHLLCNENCKGICANCGADRNLDDCGCDSQQVDPRWAGLKELVNRES